MELKRTHTTCTVWICHPWIQPSCKYCTAPAGKAFAPEISVHDKAALSKEGCQSFRADTLSAAIFDGHVAAKHQLVHAPQTCASYTTYSSLGFKQRLTKHAYAWKDWLPHKMEVRTSSNISHVCGEFPARSLSPQQAWEVTTCAVILLHLPPSPSFPCL